MIETDIWGEGELRAAVRLLDTVDQLIIDMSIIEEVKTYHRNMASAIYDSKKTYDNIPLWMDAQSIQMD